MENMTNDGDLSRVLFKIDQHRVAAARAGLEFSFLSEGTLRERQRSERAAIISVSWSGVVVPGEWMFYDAQVHNFSLETLGQMGLTTFFGPGALAATPHEALLIRDTVYPTLNSDSFELGPTATKIIKIGHRLDHPVREGFHMLNYLFWWLNNYDRPAPIFSRFHVRFRVRTAAEHEGEIEN